MNGKWLIKSVQYSLSTSGFATTIQDETSSSKGEKVGKAKKAKKENRAFRE